MQINFIYTLVFFIFVNAGVTKAQSQSQNNAPNKAQLKEKAQTKKPSSSEVLSPQATPPILKNEMTYFEKSISDLSPFLLDPNEYSNEKNAPLIAKTLAELTSRFSALSHTTKSQGSHYKFKFEALAEGFKDVEESFKSKAFDYSLWNLKSQLHQCSSCHTESHLQDRAYNQFVYKGAEPLRQAEFQFLLRDYQSAVAKYTEILKNFKKYNLSADETYRIFKRLGYFYVRVDGTNPKAKELFAELNLQKDFPQFVYLFLPAWVSTFGDPEFRISPYEKSDLKNLKKLFAKREKAAEKYQNQDQRFIYDQETLQFLINKMMTEKKPLTLSWLYYWSAKIQAPYKDSLFDTTAELYLKECVKLKANSDIVNLCQKEIEK